MVTRLTARLATALVGCNVMIALVAGSAFAQVSPGDAASTAPAVSIAAGSQSAIPAPGCFVSPAALPVADVSAFLAAPGQLLVDFPTAGLPMANRVRSLAGSSADALGALTGLVGQSNPSQVAAIGAGLARAARACAAVNPLYATQIQESVAGTPFETAFLSASAETQTAALGGAGAGGAAGAPAGAIGGAGAGQGAGTGLNGALGAGGGVASGNSAFAAGASSRYLASSGGATTIIIQLSPTNPGQPR